MFAEKVWQFMDKYTIMLPVAKNLDLANECIAHLLKVSPYKICVVDDFGIDTDYVQHDKLNFIHLQPEKRYGLGKIWNICIKLCPTERIIMASWRPRPEPHHFEIIDTYLNSGFGMVALETLHFFALPKSVLFKLGLFDEGFISGQFEDTDFFNRFYMNDIAMYVSNEIVESSYPTMWPDGSANKIYFDSKWQEQKEINTLTQFKEEENIKDRELYRKFNGIFKKFSESVLKFEPVRNYYATFYNKIKAF